MQTKSMPNLLKNMSKNAITFNGGNVNNIDNGIRDDISRADADAAAAAGSGSHHYSETCLNMDNALEPQISNQDQFSALSFLDLYDNPIHNDNNVNINEEGEEEGEEFYNDSDREISRSSIDNSSPGVVRSQSQGILPQSLTRSRISSIPLKSKADLLDDGFLHDLEHYDRYGFKKQTALITENEYNTWWNQYSEYSLRRKKKWVVFLQKEGIENDDNGNDFSDKSSTENYNENNIPLKYPSKSEKLKRYIRKGIPAEWRGEAWWFFANGESKLSANQGLYDELLSKANFNEKTNKTDDDDDDDNNTKKEDIIVDKQIIERDLNRTFPENIHFMRDSDQEPQMVMSLRRVLYAFALYDPKIGYCQSMNFLAGLLLLFLDEERAFWMLVIITSEILPNVHNRNLEGVNVDQGVLMLCLKEYLPEFWPKINSTGFGCGGNTSNSSSSSSSNSSGTDDNTDKGNTKPADNDFLFKLPPITLCTASWFMSCFIGTVPIETTLRIWDCIFYEGSHLLFKISMAIIKLSEIEHFSMANNSLTNDVNRMSLGERSGSNSDINSNNSGNDSPHPIRNSMIMRKISRNKFTKGNMSRHQTTRKPNDEEFDIELFQTFQTFPKTLINPNDIFEKIIFKKKFSFNSLNQIEIERCRKYVVTQRMKFKRNEQKIQARAHLHTSNQHEHHQHHRHQNSIITLEDLDNGFYNNDVYGFKSSSGVTFKERMLRIARKSETKE